MKPEQMLINCVQQFLTKKRNIQISIPTLHNLIDTKINLRVTSNHLPNLPHFQKQQNRYRLFIHYIESLLANSNLNLESIQSFMTAFNKTINVDIDIMQKNQITRTSTFKVKEKLVFRMNQVTKKTHVIKEKCQKLRDKEDIITFISIQLKGYLSIIKLITDQYEGVGRAEVQTPMKIDNLYEYEATSQQHYQTHYTPLLEMLLRLKTCMNDRLDEVRKSSRVDMPLKSVNLLANCKNLLLELQPFLITNQCAFNKLIFHVVTAQTQNMRMISSFYKYHLDFVKTLIYNVFKCVFLGHIFQEYYYKIQGNIQTEKKIISEYITQINYNNTSQESEKVIKKMDNSQQNLKKIKQQIKQVQSIICFGISDIMGDYLQDNLCQKLQLLLTNKQYLNTLQFHLMESYKIIKQIPQIQQQQKMLPTIKIEIIKDAQLIVNFSLQTVNEQQKVTLNNIELLFKKNYLLIQQKCIKMSQILQIFHSFSQLCPSTQIFDFSNLFNKLTNFKNQYIELEKNLINNFYKLLSEKQQMEKKIIQTCNKISKQIITYLLNQQINENQIFQSMGGQILKQDQQCTTIKQFLSNIVTAQRQIKQSRGMKNSQRQMKKLQKLRNFLQLYLQIFQGSLFDQIFQEVIDGLDFKNQDLQQMNQNIKRVNQLLASTQKYNKALKKIILQTQFRDKSSPEQPSNKILSKINKIAKQRLTLYQIIQILYSQSLFIYETLKLPKNIIHHHDIQTNGVKLFDKQLYQQVLKYYHCFNKIQVVKEQIQDANLLNKTQNFIIDEIYDCFYSKLSIFLKYNQNDWLNLALRLDKAFYIQKNYKIILTTWENLAERPIQKNQTLYQYQQKLMKASQSIVLLGQQVQKIIDLTKSKFVVLNLEEMKKISLQCKQYVKITKQIVGKSNLGMLFKGEQFKNQHLNSIIKQINQKFAKFSEEN